MKKIVSLTILCSTLIFASCGENNTETTNETTEELENVSMYQCPMKCEGDKMYEEKGTCPVCQMDLELVTENEDEHKHHNHH